MQVLSRHKAVLTVSHVVASFISLDSPHIVLAAGNFVLFSAPVCAGLDGPGRYCKARHAFHPLLSLFVRHIEFGQIALAVWIKPLVDRGVSWALVSGPLTSQWYQSV